MDFNGNKCKELLSRNLRRLREQKDLSQFRLAAELEVSSGFVSDIEAGKTWVSDTTLEKIADALHIEIYQLFRPETDWDTPGLEEAAAEARKLMDTLDESLSLHITRTMRSYLERAVERELALLDTTVAQEVKQARERLGIREE
jgi:transcriptional regulator with XRE-family HTH domain